jgi:uncharacterized protein
MSASEQINGGPGPPAPAGSRGRGPGLLLDWRAISADLNTSGYTILPALVSPENCRSLAAMYDHDKLFRNRVIMARHGYGQGEYRYFAYPLPSLVQRLRTAIYPGLAGVANDWMQDATYPPAHADYLAACHAAGQTRPTPLLLRYGAGDFNCLHQDLYGALMFPLQLAVLLSRPGEDFQGGEFVLLEQRPRQQSRVEVVPLTQGDAVVFAVNQRPVRGARGVHRVAMRHGVSRVRAGQRHTLGVIFHDAV